jgi:predicted KAP-like P-loop ATPase
MLVLGILETPRGITITNTRQALLGHAVGCIHIAIERSLDVYMSETYYIFRNLLM